MAPSFNFLIMLIFPIFLGIASLAVPLTEGTVVPAVRSVEDMSLRSTNTCADPTLARTVFQGYSSASTAHVIHFHWAFVNVDTQVGPGAPKWIFQGPVGQAWPTQQPFTSPLFRLAASAGSDFIFKIGADAQTPPVVSGFSATAVDLVGWVYDTAVCDSVPLMSAVFAAQTDHYYTTDADEHAALLSAGWTDGGVAAFVLPLPTA